jgi:hypothetical protein
MSLLSFLRHNSRHTVWLPRDGRLPQLNPICSSSHNKNGKRTVYLTEPLRLFRLRQRVFCFAGRHRCGRRDDTFAFPAGERRGVLPDTWDIGPDGNRTCSYCGSIHADDLMKICRKAIDDERYAVEGTTKSYKVYVRQPGVRNAGEGAIKFYMHHAPENPSEADQKLFAEAIRLSSERFRAQLAASRAEWAQRAAS